MARAGSLLSPAPGFRGLLAFALGFAATIWTFVAPFEALAGPEAQVIERVNQVRESRNLIPLRGSPALAGVARAHAEDMAQRGYLDHINPEGQSPLDRAQTAGVEGYRLLAENIAASAASGDRIQASLEEWLASESHRMNLLNPAFNTTGVAVVEAPGGRTLIVQLFATY